MKEEIPCYTCKVLDKVDVLMMHNDSGEWVCPNGHRLTDLEHDAIERDNEERAIAPYCPREPTIKMVKASIPGRGCAWCCSCGMVLPYEEGEKPSDVNENKKVEGEG